MAVRAVALSSVLLATSTIAAPAEFARLEQEPRAPTSTPAALSPGTLRMDTFAALRGSVTPSDSEAVVLLFDDEEHVSFSAFGRDWHLQLEPHVLLSADARDLQKDVALPHFFRGRLTGDAASWVRLTRTGAALSGHIASDGALYRLTSDSPQSGGVRADERQADTSIAYRLERVAKLDEPSRTLQRLARRTTSDPRIDADWLARAQGAGTLIPDDSGRPIVSRAIRVGVVVDSRYDMLRNGEGLARALGIMNGVDGIFQQEIGLAVVVDSVRVYDDPQSDPMADLVNVSVDDLLAAFEGVRASDPALSAELALVHLFTGHRPADQAIGLGRINTVCQDDGTDVSLSSPFVYGMLLAAHEIAHNLGALHDEDPSCHVDRDDVQVRNGIMETRISAETSRRFSRCSLDRLEDALSADCVIDAVDLAIELTRVDENDLTLTVRNLDHHRTAKRVRSRLQLPLTSAVADDSGRCRTDGVLVICNHGDIPPDSAVAITLRTPWLATGIALGTLFPGEYHDRASANDRSSLAVGAGASALAATNASDDETRSSGAAVAEPSGGVGSGSLPLATLMIMLALWRSQRSRSTEKSAMLSSASR